MEACQEPSPALPGPPTGSHGQGRCSCSRRACGVSCASSAGQQKGACTHVKRVGQAMGQVMGAGGVPRVSPWAQGTPASKLKHRGLQAPLAGLLWMAHPKQPKSIASGADNCKLRSRHRAGLLTCRTCPPKSGYASAYQPRRRGLGFRAVSRPLPRGLSRTVDMELVCRGLFGTHSASAAQPWPCCTEHTVPI